VLLKIVLLWTISNVTCDQIIILLFYHTLILRPQQLIGIRKLKKKPYTNSMQLGKWKEHNNWETFCQKRNDNNNWETYDIYTIEWVGLTILFLKYSITHTSIEWNSRVSHYFIWDLFWKWKTQRISIE
jgi:hypothetical protein